MNNELTKEELKDLLINANDEDFQAIIDYTHPVDLLEAIHKLDDEDAKIILNRFPDETLGRILEEEKDEERYDFLSQFSKSRQKEILEEMSTDEIVDFVATLNEQQEEEVLSNLNIEDLEDVKELMQYDPDTAGGIMTTEFISIRQNKTVLKTLEYLQQNGHEAEMAFYMYVVDKEDHLKGVVSVRDIITSKFDVKIEDITNPNVVSLNINDDQEVIAAIFDKYDYIMLPVVDDNNVIKGIVTVDDVIDIIQEETTEDMHLLAGVDGDEKVDSNIIESIRSRLPWLVINLITAILAASVVSRFSATIEAVVALAAINPIIAGMGGNAGNQSMTIVVRAIALNELNGENAKKVFFKELIVGMISGLTIGLLIGIGCQIVYGNFFLGIVTSLSMLLNLIIATMVGYLVPVILVKLKVDPALASSIFVTTCTDCFGFFIFLSLATLVLPYII
ncbi:MAG: magnesium transporter [Erysipelotrichaceae bacterium]|nr:magnesium transporter [Erysipelotrichaceae bacterium]